MLLLLLCARASANELVLINFKLLKHMHALRTSAQKREREKNRYTHFGEFFFVCKNRIELIEVYHHS